MRAGERIDSNAFDAIRRTMMLEHFKWDAHVAGADALASFPLLLTDAEWSELSSAAERLTREMFDAEQRILEVPKALDALGVPRRARPLLERLRDDATPSLGRIVRFDFHPTSKGWRISEANSDVPGGFSEATAFTHLMADACGHAKTGDPSKRWVDAIVREAPDSIALLVAPGWLEDMQVVMFLARALRDRGCRAEIVTPNQLEWRDGIARTSCAVSGIVRFHQLEWIADWAPATAWHSFFVGAKTPISNPAIAMVSESKRFPIAATIAGASMPTWTRYLPETRDPRDVSAIDDGWTLKGAFCNTGDTVIMKSETSAARWRWHALSARALPLRWVAQRRFDPTPIETVDGPHHVCVGVYTVNGVTAGAYARISTHGLIDYRAIDTAVLTEHEHAS